MNKESDWKWRLLMIFLLLKDETTDEIGLKFTQTCLFFQWLQLKKSGLHKKHFKKQEFHISA